MIEFILIWLLWWLLVIATLQNVFKGNNWFIRYMFFVGLPVTLIAVYIAAWIIISVYKVPFKPTIRFLFVFWLTGKDKNFELPQ